MIDRADLIGLLLPALHATTVAGVPLADAILALEKPADGITLSIDEASTAHAACWNTISEFEGAWPDEHLAPYRALSARLEPLV